MSPSFSDLYPILRLPRISDLGLSNRVCVASISGKGLPQENSKYFHLAISALSIATYVLVPSPKLVWSHSLSPSIKVNCLSVYHNSANQTAYFAAGLYNSATKKHFLRVINRKDAVAEEASNSEETTVDTEVDLELCEISFSKSGTHIYLFFLNGDVQARFFNGAVGDSSGRFIKNKGKVLFHRYIGHIDSQGLTTINNNDGFYLCVRSIKDRVVSSLYLLNGGEIAELHSSLLNEKPDSALFTYSAGTLYALSTDKKNLALYTILSGHKAESMDLGPLFQLVAQRNGLDQIKGDLISILSPSGNRILLNIYDSIFLLNTKFETVLSDYKLLVSPTHEKGSPVGILLKVPEVKGTSERTLSTSLNMLIRETDNNTSVYNVAVDVGTNSLAESLQKGLHLYCRKHGLKLKLSQELVLKPLVTPQTFASGELGSENPEDTRRAKALLKSLSSLAAKNKSAEFDLQFLNYVKQKEASIDKVKSLYKVADLLDLEHKYYGSDAETNKIYDFVLKGKHSLKLSTNLFDEIMKLIFSVNESEDGAFSYSLKSKKFLPKFSVIYLVNSSLFSPAYSDGLLRKFADEPVILNLIISNHSLKLSADDILLLLCRVSGDAKIDLSEAIGDNQFIDNGDDDLMDTLDDSEILTKKDNDLLFKKIVNLLLGSKSDAQIVQSVKELMNSSAPEHKVFQEKFENVLYKLINLNHGAKLLNLIIDGIGIMNFKFNDPERLDDLMQYADSKIKEIMSLKTIETVLDDLISGCEKATVAASKANPSIEGPRIVSVKDEFVEEKLNAILGVKGTIETGESAKVPSYSIERLIEL